MAAVGTLVEREKEKKRSNSGTLQENFSPDSCIIKSSATTCVEELTNADDRNDLTFWNMDADENYSNAPNQCC
jgi:hypothetical protein